MSKKPVLVIEDDPAIRNSVVDLLGDEGYPVSAAENGARALQMLSGMPELPGMILLDIMTPVMNGYEFRRNQTQDPRIAEIPTVMFSADGSIATKAGSVGLKEYLKKPFELEKLLRMVEKHCG